MLLVTAHYMLDTLVFKKWATEEMGDLIHEHLMFIDFGLVVTIRQGKWDKASFMFANHNQDDLGINLTWIPLQLLSHEVTFRMHRDLGSREDWCVYYDEPLAAQTADA